MGPPHKVQYGCSDIFGYVTFYWSTVDLPGTTLLEETDHLYPSSSQLPIVPELGVGLHSHLPMLRFRLDLACTELVYTVTAAMNSYVQRPWYILKITFPCSCPPALAPTFFQPLLPQLSQSLWRKVYSVYVLFGAEHYSASVPCLDVGSLCYCHLFQIEASLVSDKRSINLWA